jgi:hypothetical protein
MQRMFEHQTSQILQFPAYRLASALAALTACIQHSLHEVQEAGFRAIMLLALYIRMNLADPGVQTLLEGLLMETMGCLFIGGVDTENVSNACAAVHGLAVILPVSLFTPQRPRMQTHPFTDDLLCHSVLIADEIRKFMSFGA